MNLQRFIKSRTFLFGIIIMALYVLISVIIYNFIVLKMERDMDADNNIQLKIIKLSSSIGQTIKSAQDVVYFSQNKDKEKELKSSLLSLNFLINSTDRRFKKLNKSIKKTPFLRKAILLYEVKAYHNWKNLIVPILARLIIHHKIMAKKAFMEPLFISMYKATPNYAPLMESGFKHRIKDALYFHLILNIIFIADFFLFFIVLMLFIFNISIKELKIEESEKKYNNLVEFLPIGIYQATIDKEGHFTDVNDYMVKIFEASGKEELMNTKIVDLYVEGKERADVVKSIIKEGVYEFEGKRRTLKGGIIDVYIACRMKKDGYGNDVIDCVLLDITKEKELEKRLKENEELFSAIVNGMAEGVYINDTKILYANPAAVEFFGYPEKELYSMHTWDLFGEKDRPIIKANIERRLKGEQFYTEYVFDTFTKKGEEKHILFHVRTIVYQRRFVALAIFFDITDKVLLERALEREKLHLLELSETDHLTGIFNRRKLEKSLGEYVKLAVRYNRPLSLIMFDIDHFKEINDSYGHQVGDNVLIELANLVKINLRETDFFARFGGEEFMILMPETNLAYTKAKAESLRKLIEKNTFKFIYRLTCSFGVIEYSEKDNLGDTQDIINSLIKRVDSALYRAKGNGRNRVEEDV